MPKAKVFFTSGSTVQLKDDDGNLYDAMVFSLSVVQRVDDGGFYVVVDYDDKPRGRSRIHLTDFMHKVKDANPELFE